MTVEYVLLLFVFAMTIMQVMIKMPRDAFYTSGPALGARVERLISTGDKFLSEGQPSRWNKPNTNTDR
jgi:hypothetical protein